jgi:hypothetical protein
MKTIAQWMSLAVVMLVAGLIGYGWMAQSDGVPVDGVQVFDTPEVAATPEAVVAPDVAVYSNVRLHTDFGRGYSDFQVAWVRLYPPSHDGALWTLDTIGETLDATPSRDAAPPIELYAQLDGRAGKLYVQAVLVTDEFKATNTLDDRLPLAPALEPAMADVAASGKSKSAGVADAAAELVKLYAVESKRETRKRSKIMLPEVDDRDVLFARQQYGR